MAKSFLPFFKFTDSDNVLLSSARVVFTNAGTVYDEGDLGTYTNLKDVYADYDEAVVLPNPMTLDSSGMFPNANGVWLGAGRYRIAVYLPDGMGGFESSPLYVIDNYLGEDSGASSSSIGYVDTVALLRTFPSATASHVLVGGYSTAGDGGGGSFNLANATIADNDGVNISSDVIGKTWVRDAGATADVYASWFGVLPAIGDIATNLSNAEAWSYSENKTLVFQKGLFQIESSVTIRRISRMSDILTAFFSNTANTITFQGGVIAGRYQMITGNNVTLVIQNMTEVYPEWWNVSSSNSASVNATYIDRVLINAVGVISFKQADINLNAKDFTLPVKFEKGSSLIANGKIRFLNGIEGFKGCLKHTSTNVFSFYQKDEIPLSWFVDASSVNNRLAFAHGSCDEYLNTLLLDESVSVSSTYTQSGNSANRLIDSTPLSTSVTCTLNKVSAISSTVFILSGSGKISFLNTPVVNALWFGDNIQGAINSSYNLVLDGLGSAISKSAPIELAGYLRLRNLALTVTAGNALNIKDGSNGSILDNCIIQSSDATAVYMDGSSGSNNQIKISNSFLSGVSAFKNDSTTFKAIIRNCTLTNEDTVNGNPVFSNTDISGSSIVNGVPYIYSNVSSLNNEYKCIATQIKSESSVIKNVSMIGDKIHVSKSGFIYTGQLQIYANQADTVVNGLNLDSLNFVGSFDAGDNVIQAYSGVGANYDADPTLHTYKSIGHICESVLMNALVTDKKYVVSKSIASAGNALHSIELTANNGLLVLSADEHTVWSGVFGFNYGDADPQIRKDLSSNTVSFVGYWTATSPTPPYDAEFNIHLARVQ